MSDEVRPFTVEISADAVADLRDRLGRTRWPNPEPVDDWSQGIPLAYTQGALPLLAERVRLRRGRRRG